MTFGVRDGCKPFPTEALEVYRGGLSGSGRPTDDMMVMVCAVVPAMIVYANKCN